MQVSKRAFLIALVLATVTSTSIQAEPSQSYLDRLSVHKARFVYTEPAPQDYENDRPPAGVELVTFTSGNMTLKAWLALPPGTDDGPVPAVVYLYGGFAFGESDFQDAGAFLRSGFALMAPTLRGENGNPGHFEMFLGEVDDAAAAVAWLANDPRIDASQIFVFGHSAGGAIAALLSLRNGVNLVDSGSSGGLYQDDIFSAWSDIVPFDIGDKQERDLRLLLGNQRWMQKPHFAYVSKDDNGRQIKKAANMEVKNSESLLEVTIIPGDHWTSLPEAMDLYLEHIRKTDGIRVSPTSACTRQSHLSRSQVKPTIGVTKAMSDISDDAFQPEYHTREEAMRIAHAEAVRALQESPHSISYVCYDAFFSHDYAFCYFVREAGGWVKTFRSLTPEERLPEEEIKDETILELACAGNTIAAIRLYRSKHQVGLREASDAVRKLNGSWDESYINPAKKWWQFWK